MSDEGKNRGLASMSVLPRSAGLDCTIGGSRVCASPVGLGGGEDVANGGFA